MTVFFTQCKESGHHYDQLASQSREHLLKATYNNFIENAWNNGNMDSLRAVSATNYIKHLNGIQIAANQSEMEANMHMYFTGFPDGRVSVKNIEVNNDQLYANWVYTATNTGIFGEFPATGKKISIHGFTKIRFNEIGKMAREEVYFNELELLQQLGYTLNPPVVE